MHRFVLLSAAALSLAACQPQVPDSARGVGFESYSDYMARRDAGLAGQPMSAARPFDNQVISSGPIGMQPAGTPLDARGGVQGQADVLSAERPRADAPATIRAGSGISDEQNFDAVAQRETIASDAERRRAQQAQYVQIQPTELPQRDAGSQPNIVGFALSTGHNPGTKMYGRSAFRFKSYETACAPFTSADMAQEEFLRRGGPKKDPLNVDPDGDGFACGWDPRPFRIR